MTNVPTKELKLEILGGDINYKSSAFGYIVEGVTVVIKNVGDLPVYIGEIDIKYGAESWKMLSYVGSKISPGAEKTIEVKTSKYLDTKPTSVRIRIVDKDKIIAEGSI